MNVTKTFSALAVTLAMCSCEKEKLNEPPIVDAGIHQTIQLPEDEIILSGTATDPDGQVLAYAWSQVSGPAPSILLNPGSASTTLTVEQSGTYLFQLLATDNDGATGVDTVSIKLLAPLVVSKSFQPSNNSNELHLQGNQYTDYNSSGAPELVAGLWTVGGETMKMRGAFKFDLSQIPSSAKIVSARLSLYSNPTPINGDHSGAANSGSDNAFAIQRITGNWNNTITWQQQPSTTEAGQVLFPHTTQSSLDIINADVKEMVQEMISTANYGFMIKLQHEVNLYNIRNFCSSKHAQSSKHPKLIVEYTL